MEQADRPGLPHVSSLLQPLGIRIEPRMGKDQTYSNSHSEKYGPGFWLSITFYLLGQLGEGRPSPG